MSKWLPIEQHSKGAAIIRTFEGREFAAVLDYPAMDENGNDVMVWREMKEGTAPPCWSGGACWGSNEDESPSDPPVEWVPLPEPPKDKP